MSEPAAFTAAWRAEVSLEVTSPRVSEREAADSDVLDSLAAAGAGVGSGARGASAVTDSAASSSAVHAMSGTSTVVTSSTAIVVVFRSALCGSDWGTAGAAFATPAAIAVSATPAADAKAIGRAAFVVATPSTTEAVSGRRAWR